MKLNKIKKPHEIFAEITAVDSKAIDQFCSAMELDCTIQGALMPDVHAGYTLPIGAVVKTQGMIFPSWVGYDIGCGMLAIQTDFDIQEIKDNAQAIYEMINKTIPLGFNHRCRPHALSDLAIQRLSYCSQDMQDIFVLKKGELQCGTLGGGNHFIEIGYDEESKIWIIIHSGSRGVGHGCATHYMKLASPTGKASEGHYGFDIDSINGENYHRDMAFCEQFALLNREIMIDEIMAGINELGINGVLIGFINRNHNHAEVFKDGTIIHRKGATHAENGMMGVIPGNMRDGSFIVEGLGNPDSLCSSSHGAGRVLGRRVAKETLNVDDFADTMNGIVANVSDNTLDESPFAYKNIFQVMEDQEDLVKVHHHIKPILNVKG